LSPWPRWEWPAPRAARATARSNEQDAVAHSSANPELASALESEARTSPINADTAAAWNRFWKEFSQELRYVPAAAVQESWRWTGIFGALVLLLTALGLLRLAAGLVAVQACRRRAVIVRHQELQESLDVVRAELNCLTPIELRESCDLSTA